MAYEVVESSLPDVLVLQPKVFSDDRGLFFESFNDRDFKKATGLNRTFVQDNHSRSTMGVLRGLHYQIEHPQGKLVRVVQGVVFDVVVDLRRNSASFGKWSGTTLSAENKMQLWVPEGFAHGFLVLSEATEVLYKTTDYWYSEHERSLLWNDPTVAVDWPIKEMPLLAKKDEMGTLIAEADLFR